MTSDQDLPLPPTKRFRARPTSPAGMRAAKFAGLAFAIFVLANIITQVRFHLVGDRFSLLFQVFGPVIGISFIVTGFGTLINAVIAVTRQHERSAVIWLALLMGVFAAFFIIGDLLIPH